MVVFANEELVSLSVNMSSIVPRGHGSGDLLVLVLTSPNIEVRPAPNEV